jgi:hypothetical protein
MLWRKGLARPVYVGETRKHPCFGKRMGRHFRIEKNQWCRVPTHVQYLSDARLDDPWVRKLFERWVFVLTRPLENDPDR